MNTIQGNNVILALMKDDWVTLLCASDMSLSMNLSTLENKTIGDGHWASFAHEKLSYTVNVSGLAILNDTDDQTNFSAFDQANHWIKSIYVQFRLSFYDDAMAIKTFQGYALVSDLSFDITTGALVKDSCTLTGTGELLFFDGLIACDSLITSITVTGQTAADGIIHIAYTYTGAPLQIKYRIDGAGAWIITAISAPIAIPGLVVGSHSVEMIPICANGYDADHSTSQSFVVTQSLTCTGVFDDVTFGPANISAAPHISAGSPTMYKWRIDGGAWTTSPIAFIVSLAGQSVGVHSIEMVPICSNGVEGTGVTKPFTIASAPAQSNVAWAFSSWKPSNILQIYTDTGSGFILAQTPAIGSSGTMTVPTGAQVRTVLQGTNSAGSHMEMRTNDTTISSILDDQTGTVPNTFTFTWTTNGDDYAINATITP